MQKSCSIAYVIYAPYGFTGEMASNYLRSNPHSLR
jgi:hypothetical protein